MRLYGICISSNVNFGMHSSTEMCVSGIINGRGLYLVFLFFTGINLHLVCFYSMYVFLQCNSLLRGNHYVELPLNSLMEIILFVIVICCILCYLIDSIGINKFGIFW